MTANGVTVDFGKAVSGRADKCEPDDPCTNVTCLNDGVCRPDFASESFSCHCQVGFTGQLCETNVDPCSLSLCRNGGLCQASGSNFSCNCPDEFDGEFCERARHLCNETINGVSYHKCADDRYCHYDVASHTYRCACPINKLGEFCEQGDEHVSFCVFLM